MTNAPSGEIDELEAIIRSAERVLNRTEHLPDDARLFLEEIADRCRDRHGGPEILDLASASPRLRSPADLTWQNRRETLSGLLASSGVFEAANGQLRFARTEVRDYLAAHHVFRRHPRGPRLAAPTTWKYFVPRKNWPWPDGGVQAFLAALWWRPAKPAIERRLRNLLHRRHRAPNIRFVVDLLHRDLLPGSDLLREQTLDVLREALRDDELDDERWTASVGQFQAIDPAAAADELDAMVCFAASTASSRRRYQAVVALIDHDRPRGMKAVRILARNPTGTAQDRFDTAILIRDLDPAEGVVAMQQLAATEDMADLRVDAAIALGRRDLLSELVTEEGRLSDDARSKALGELLRLESDTAITFAERFAETTADDETPLRIAEQVRPFDRRAALRMAARTAEREDERADSEVRYRAALLVGEIDPGQAVPALVRLSESGSATFRVRLRAATRIMTEHGGPIDAVVALANDSRIEWADRAKAAGTLEEIHPRTCAELLVTIARSEPPTDAGRFTLLQRAYQIDSRQAEPEIVELAKHQLVAGHLRLRAVELVGAPLKTAVTIGLYAEIVETADGESALTAARKVIAMNHPEGQRLMGKVADRAQEKPQFRLTAAREAGTYGKNTLQNLAQKGRPDSFRLAAAKALYKIDRASGRAALEKLVKRATPGRVRIAAALSLPGPAVVGALTSIVHDPKAGDEVRRAAANQAWEIDPNRGRALVEALADDPATSTRTRERIRNDLRR
ncbi:hypothetical protein [Amycolatopsis solani]|uniref:hypothetical protein n=1 Tax=Amycolatopsis solani TaxID=3028615 RepID=UPI0025AF8A8B|nr:hypothetical protein [Amycolatopsis sp. MEP2-6]